MTEINDVMREDGRIDARMLNSGDPSYYPEGGGYVDEQLCNRLRKVRQTLDTDRALSEKFDIPVNTCRDHLRGRCHHDPETDPVEAQIGGDFR